jgi:hypothetical protein
MVGDSSGHGEAPIPSGIEGRGPKRRSASSANDSARNGGGAGDPRENVRRAADSGRISAAQGKALEDLLSRMGLLDFESRRIISVIVNNIALEESADKRGDLAAQLQEYLEGDGLAKDVAAELSNAFSQA